MGVAGFEDPKSPSLLKMLLHHDATRHRLLAWCVMPNHVHALIETWAGFRLPGIVKSWKGVTSRRANAVLGRSGRFWMADSYDRFLRDEDHYRNVTGYIELNPVKAGWVEKPADWLYSSARSRSLR